MPETGVDIGHPLVPLVGDRLGSAEITPELIAGLSENPVFIELRSTKFKNWPPHSFMSDEARTVLFALIRMMRPKEVAEVGTLFAGTTEVMARALWENGWGNVHTTDPFGAERCPKIIAGWPQDLQRVTHFYPMNSMEFFGWLEQRRITLDLVLVDGNHDYEFAMFDLQMAARLLRPGGIVVMDNAEQTGPFQAARTFVARNTAWRELGNCIASYDPHQPFDASRASVPKTTFVILQAPKHVSVGPDPHSWGQREIDANSVSGFSLDLPAQTTSGTLIFQAIFRAFGDGNRDGAELKSLGSFPIDLHGEASMVTHDFVGPLSSDMASKHADAKFTFEIDLAWLPNPGSPPLALASLPSAIPSTQR